MTSSSACENNKKNNQVWFKRFYLSNRWSVDCIDNNIFCASIVLYASILLYYIAHVSIIQNGVGVNVLFGDLSCLHFLNEERTFKLFLRL